MSDFVPTGSSSPGYVGSSTGNVYLVGGPKASPGQIAPLLVRGTHLLEILCHCPLPSPPLPPPITSTAAQVAWRLRKPFWSPPGTAFFQCPSSWVAIQPQQVGSWPAILAWPLAYAGLVLLYFGLSILVASGPWSSVWKEKRAQPKSFSQAPRPSVSLGTLYFATLDCSSPPNQDPANVCLSRISHVFAVTFSDSSTFSFFPAVYRIGV